MISVKKISNVFNKKKGFCYGDLDTKDYKLILELIDKQFNRLIKKSSTKYKDEINLKNYNSFFKKIKHEKIFTKKNRLLGKRDCQKIINKTKLFQNIKSIFGKIFITDEEKIGHSNIYWRCVRPKPYNDVGPFHKDKWFWDLGCGKINKNYQRVKIWISILSDNKKLGFRFVRGSAAKNFEFDSEFRDHIVKPIFDDKRLKKEKIESVRGKNGSFIIFNDELLHAGEVINSKKCRLSLEFTFCCNKKNILNIFKFLK